MINQDSDLSLDELIQKYRNDPNLVLYLFLMAYMDDLPILRGRIKNYFEVIRGAWISYYGPRLATHA